MWKCIFSVDELDQDPMGKCCLLLEWDKIQYEPCAHVSVVTDSGTEWFCSHCVMGLEEERDSLLLLLDSLHSFQITS